MHWQNGVPLTLTRSRLRIGLPSHLYRIGRPSKRHCASRASLLALDVVEPTSAVIKSSESIVLGTLLSGVAGPLRSVLHYIHNQDIPNMTNHVFGTLVHKYRHDDKQLLAPSYSLEHFDHLILGPAGSLQGSIPMASVILRSE